MTGAYEVEALQVNGHVPQFQKVRLSHFMGQKMGNSTDARYFFEGQNKVAPT